MNDQRGIVLDETTAAVVPVGSCCEFSDDGSWLILINRGGAQGDILTHIGGRPVAELVAAHGQAKTYAKTLRTAVMEPLVDSGTNTKEWLACLAAAEHLDHVADMLIAPELVAAWHAQYDGECA